MDLSWTEQCWNWLFPLSPMCKNLWDRIKERRWVSAGLRKVLAFEVWFGFYNPQYIGPGRSHWDSGALSAWVNFWHSTWFSKQMPHVILNRLTPQNQIKSIMRYSFNTHRSQHLSKDYLEFLTYKLIACPASQPGKESRHELSVACHDHPMSNTQQRV